MMSRFGAPESRARLAPFRTTPNAPIGYIFGDGAATECPGCGAMNFGKIRKPGSSAPGGQVTPFVGVADPTIVPCQVLPGVGRDRYRTVRTGCRRRTCCAVREARSNA